MENSKKKVLYNGYQSKWNTQRYLILLLKKALEMEKEQQDESYNKGMQDGRNKIEKLLTKNK